MHYGLTLIVSDYRRRSLLGVRFWASQRLLENALRRAGAPLQGTWAMHAYLRLLGANLGAWATFRMTNSLLVPDMLDVRAGAHVGDAANLVATYAADADTVVVGRIELGQQVCVPAPNASLRCILCLGHKSARLLMLVYSELRYCENSLRFCEPVPAGSAYQMALLRFTHWKNLKHHSI